MIRLWFAAILFLSCDSAGWAAEKPALAIINSSGNHAAADLLFSKLSAGGDFVLVEREHLAEILHEQQLSSLSAESNVRTGKLLGADALLFVEPERTLLHLRLVETSRGERVFDEVFPLALLDVPSMVETVQERLSLLAAKLQMEYQVQLSAGGPATSFSLTLDRNQLAEASAAISAKIALLPQEK